jgi:hypothetical protein
VEIKKEMVKIGRFSDCGQKCPMSDSIENRVLRLQSPNAPIFPSKDGKMKGPFLFIGH